MLNFGNKEFRNLQEQVLKNAQDIETLKSRENLQIVIVEELPEEGNPNYIYLVPNNEEEESNVYDEYIWLEDEERYEKIGGVSIDLTNYVTLNTAQTISGSKTFDHDIVLYAETGDSPSIVFQRGTEADTLNDWKIVDTSGFLRFACRTGGAAWDQVAQITTGGITPYSNNTKDLGTADTRWRDLHLSNAIFITTGNGKMEISASGNNLNIWTLNSSGTRTGWSASFLSTGNISTRTVIPATNSTYNLGSSSSYWDNLYLTGNISNGANTVSVANIASKVTSTFISGTFDSNGESTIDTEQAGTPEGLLIFTYGNCQCFLRLTATMIQNADTTPIRVACPMIYNSDTVNGWLNITKSGNILILKITDGTNHVDSGYAWTLTQTNLI